MTVEEWLGKDNGLGISIFNKKYLYKKTRISPDGNEEVVYEETFDEWLDRVSNKNKDVKRLILEKKFLFGGRILSNRNLNERGVTYSNCYVIDPVDDSIESIYDTCAKLARTFSFGGGCGVDISRLRPKGATVNNSAKTTTGAVSFMQTLSMVSETIGQNSRRGQPKIF